MSRDVNNGAGPFRGNGCDRRAEIARASLAAPHPAANAQLARRATIDFSEDRMNSYGAKEMAEAFRTVRRNTLQIANDIPEDKYSFRATADAMSVGEELAHIACATIWAVQAHAVDKKTFISFEDFGAYMSRTSECEKALTGKPDVISALIKNGEEFANFLERLTPEQLAEFVRFPPPVQPSTKSRFEMLLGVKEHEMHHRAKLMVMERLLGIVPHLTRARQQRQAPAHAPAPAPAPAAKS
jgi:uncharacterized damage-inducible protein DinB